jgi:hypothetical protein
MTFYVLIVSEEKAIGINSIMFAWIGREEWNEDDEEVGTDRRSIGIHAKIVA